MSAPSVYCSGSGRSATETTDVNGARWGRCRGCRQWRPLYAYRDDIKVHMRVVGLVPTAEQETP